MGLDGAEADVQLVGDVDVGSTARNGGEDLFFASRQRFDGLSRR